MSGPLGDFDASAVIYGKFSTFRPSTGATFTLAGSPALSVYKDNSTTQSTAGVTLTVDFDSVTGLHHFAIDTSADGTFYSAGSFFDVVITAGTVDSVSVTGSVVASFTLRKNSSLKPATSGRTLVVDAAGLADANAVKVGPSGAGTAQTARDIGASVLLSAGTGAGQLDFTSGVVKANTTQLAGQAVSAAAGVTFPASVASPTNITAGTITNLTNAPTNGDLTSTMKTSVQAAADAAVTANTLINAIAGYIDTEVAAIKAKTDNLPSSPAAVSDIPTSAQIVAAMLTTQIAEAYRANGAAPTLAQFMCEALAHLGEATISGTTKTLKKLDHTTTAETFTLDSATTPAAITRAT